MNGNDGINSAANFWAKVAVGNSEDCWEWLGAKDPNGYGRVSIWCKKSQLAYRVAWKITHGVLFSNACILHRCDNPSCVNPSHLFIGTQKDNAEDRESKRRSPRGEDRPNSKLTEDAVLHIREIAQDKSMSFRALSRRYGVSLKTILQVVSGRTWGHV